MTLASLQPFPHYTRRAAVSLAEYPDEIVCFHPEIQSDILHRDAGTFSHHLKPPLQPQVLEVFMRGYAILLQEQSLEMLHGIADGGSQISDQ